MQPSDPASSQPPFSPDRRVQPARQDRFDREVAETRTRLQRVCANWAPDDFERFLVRVAQIRLKYLMRRSEDLFVNARNAWEQKNN